MSSRTEVSNLSPRGHVILYHNLVSEFRHQSDITPQNFDFSETSCKRKELARKTALWIYPKIDIQLPRDANYCIVCVEVIMPPKRFRKHEILNTGSM
jgi:hypothetical protein